MTKDCRIRSPFEDAQFAQEESVLARSSAVSEEACLPQLRDLLTFVESSLSILRFCWVVYAAQESILQYHAMHDHFPTSDFVIRDGLKSSFLSCRNGSSLSIMTIEIFKGCIGKGCFDESVPYRHRI